jgi:short-subunit dehydrogenase
MVDNQKELMENLSKRVMLKFGVKTLQLHIDLRDTNAVPNILNELNEYTCRLMIYNAAHSLIKPFILHVKKELEDILEINVTKQILLVHGFTRYLIKNNYNGGILLMSSLAGLLGMNLVSPYAATKAFAWNLAEGLHYELKSRQIDVMACVAGATSTPSYLKTNPNYGYLKPTVMNPLEVAEKSLKKLGEKALFIPGYFNRLNYFILTRLLPRNLAAKFVNNTMVKMYVKIIN